MKKIAHICTSSISYSILIDKLKLLEQKGYDVQLISSNDGYDESLFASTRIKTHFIKMKRVISLKDDFISIIKMVGHFRKEKYDIVHTHTAKAGIIGRIAAKLARVPVIIHTSHGLPFYEGQKPVKYKFYKFLEKIASHFCDALSSQNKEDIKLLKKMAPNKPIYYEGNGVDINGLDEKFHNIREAELLQLRSSLGIDKDTKIILVAARFEPVKDHFFLLNGLKELKKSYQNFICILAGDGPLREEITRIIEKNEMRKFLILAGHQEDIYPFIKMADIVALTSIKEGIPRIVMEAMTFAKPVVATNVLGTRELVQNHITGNLVEYKNEKNLAEALLQLLENSTIGTSYGINGRRAIEEEFTEEIVVNRLISIYNELQKIKGYVQEMGRSTGLPF